MNVDSVKISLIRQFTLTNFVEKHQDLDQQFSFLANCNEYSHYYKNLELSKDYSEKMNPCEIDGLGSLIPLKSKHTLNSYWKSFRLPLKSEENRNSNELFFLLPLKIKIPITSIKANNKKFPIQFYVYLFPFGSCNVNMEINIPVLNRSLDTLPKLISDIMISNFDAEKGSFTFYSNEIAKRINKVFFGSDEGIKKSPVHTLIFLDTSEFLSLDDPEQKAAIVAIMKRRNFEDVSTWTEEKLNDMIKCELKKCRRDEIIIFHPECTFIYPSHMWIRKATKENKIKRKSKCMYNNYCSFLNVIFAVNKFLDSFLNNSSKLPEKKIQEITKCFTTAFSESPREDFNNIYFENLFNDIASEIKLKEKLKILRKGEFNECT